MQRKLYFKSSVENHKNWVTKVIFSVYLLSVCVSFFVFFILSVLRIQSKQFLNFILSKSSPPFLFSWHQSVEVASPSTVCNRIVVTFALHKHDTNLCEKNFKFEIEITSVKKSKKWTASIFSEFDAPQKLNFDWVRIFFSSENVTIWSRRVYLIW